jgi:hypothetical protein
MHVIDVTASTRGGIPCPAAQLLRLRRLTDLDAFHPMRLPPGLDVRHVERLDVIDDLSSWTPRCRHILFHARQPADHPYYRPLMHHANSLLRLCLGGAGHG